jgi:hypothetical protein
LLKKYSGCLYCIDTLPRVYTTAFSVYFFLTNLVDRATGGGIQQGISAGQHSPELAVVNCFSGDLKVEELCTVSYFWYRVLPPEDRANLFAKYLYGWRNLL